MRFSVFDAIDGFVGLLSSSDRGPTFPVLERPALPVTEEPVEGDVVFVQPASFDMLA